MENIPQQPNIDEELKEIKSPGLRIALKNYKWQIAVAISIIVTLWSLLRDTTTQAMKDKDKQIVGLQSKVDTLINRVRYWQLKKEQSDSTGKADVAAAKKETMDVLTQAGKDKDEAIKFYQSLFTITKKVK